MPAREWRGLRRELVLEAVAGAAGAGAERAAALDHEAVDDAVERQAVVERPVDRLAGDRILPRLGAFGEADEVGDGLGRDVVEQLDDEGALVRGEVRVGAWLSGHGPRSLFASAARVKRGRTRRGQLRGPADGRHRMTTMTPPDSGASPQLADHAGSAAPSCCRRCCRSTTPAASSPAASASRRAAPSSACGEAAGRAGVSLDRAAAVHVYLRDAADFAAMNEAYAPFFPVDPPTRTTVVAPPRRSGGAGRDLGDRDPGRRAARGGPPGGVAALAPSLQLRHPQRRHAVARRPRVAARRRRQRRRRRRRRADAGHPRQRARAARGRRLRRSPTSSARASTSPTPATSRR